MTQMDLFQNATSSPQDIRANLSVLPGSEEAQKMTDTSGLSFLPLLKPNDPLFAFSKMFLGMSLWASTKCYLTWKGKATPQGRSLFQLVPRTHFTDETDSGSSVEMWATPNTMDHLPQRSQEALEKQANTTRKGRARPSNLREQVNPDIVEAWEKAQEPNMWATPRASDMKEGRTLNEKGQRISKSSDLVFGANLADQVKMWPTPRACTAMSAENIHNRAKDKFPNLESEVARSMWPTPTARDHKDSGENMNLYRDKRQDTQLAIVTKRLEPEKTGSLNPEWVEWLMGYPIGWTALED